MWTYPGKKLTRMSVCVLPEWHHGYFIKKPWIGSYGVCSDYIGEIKNEK